MHNGKSGSEEGAPLVTFSASSSGTDCPFGNKQISFSLIPGGCVWLQGPSGRGKTTLASTLCSILPNQAQTLSKLDIQLDKLEWDPFLPLSERCGVLFQQSTLLDELTVGGNLAAALSAVNYPFRQRERRIKELLELVGLTYHNDAPKQPTELSGGMSRRASLALQLAQKKHVIFLDEPFTGLDREVAISIAKELVQLRRTQGVAFVLITHEEEYGKIVMAEEKENNGDRTVVGNVICSLTEPQHLHKDEANNARKSSSNIFYGTTFFQRFTTKILDYFFYSLPLILLAFLACGLAISMLTCDTLRQIDVTSPVLQIVDKEIRPMIKMLTGEEAKPLHLMGVRMKVSSMLNQTVPPAKATLYAIGMAKLFVLEIGPLLTALLLCGRIGGSYAGKLATMYATSQVKLLQTLGIKNIFWSFMPAICAAGIAGPMLTAIGTGLALFAGGKTGPFYGIGSSEAYWEEVKNAIFPSLRLKLFSEIESISQLSSIRGGMSIEYLLPTFSDSYWDGMIEIVTYPPMFHFIKALSFMAIIMGTAEVSARIHSNVTPRGVPKVITQSVVTAGLLVIILDWWFSQLWLKRH